ncbi:hypothetical protein Tco_1551458, partial [Tanacetum coccineum]
LPERLVHTYSLDLDVAKVNESLGLIEYYVVGDIRFCGVWTRNDGANKTFSKIYTIKDVGKSLICRVLAFRNNNEVIMELEDDNNDEYRIEVYEPLSGLISGVGINGNQRIFSARCRDQAVGNADEGGSVLFTFLPEMCFVCNQCYIGRLSRNYGVPVIACASAIHHISR